MANRLRQLRLSKNMKQIELCKQMNVTQATLSNWERGVFDIDTKTLIRLSEFFDVSIDYILGVTDVRKNADDLTDPTDKNMIRVLGFGGSSFERELTEEQVGDVMQYIDFLKAKEKEE